MSTKKVMSLDEERRQEEANAKPLVQNNHLCCSRFHVCTFSICIAAASFAFCSSIFRLVCVPVNGMVSNVVPVMNAALKMRARFMFSGGFPFGPSRRAFIAGKKLNKGECESEWVGP